MAHELEFVNGVASIAYAGQKPWHGLGIEIPDDLTPEEIMKAAQLDWNVAKVPAFVEIDGKKILTRQSALVRDRDNKILDMVSDDWNPCQNSEAFDFFCDFTETGGMKMETAGALRGGQMVWALAKIQDGFTLFGGDRVEGYLLFSNPHMYGKAIDVGFSAIRVVCNNTLRLALNNSTATMAKISHRKQFNAEEVKEILGISHVKMEKYREMAEFLGSVRYTQESLQKYFEVVFPFGGKSENDNEKLSLNAKKALEIVHTQPGAKYAEGTFWQGFNTVTYMVDHIIGRTGDSRLYSAWYGSNKDLKVNALQQAVEMAKAA